MPTANLISDEYKKLNHDLHETNEAYGTSGHVHAETVEALAEAMGAESLLDYGCGKETLKDALSIDIKGYDPCIPGLDAEPEPVDFVVCTDVLEHIEPELLDNVLEHIASLAKKGVFLVVHTGPAVKVLADGRNAHLIQEGLEWWRKRFDKYFEQRGSGEQSGHVFFIGKPYGD